MPKSDHDIAVHHEVMYEARDVNARVIALVVAGIILSGLVINEGVKLSYNYFSRAEFRGTQPVTLVKQPRPSTPQPQLQVDPAQDLERFRQSEKQILDSYGWVDRQKGIVRIPIDEAMKLALARGLPSAEKAAPSPSPTKGAGQTK
jgi:hypothetical protein